MKSSVYFLKTPWIIASLLPIFTFAYGYFSNFAIIFFVATITLILISSGFLFMTLSKHNVQVLKEEQSQQEDKHIKISNKDEDEVNKDFLDMGLPESFSENEIIGRFSSTSEEDSDFDRRRFSGKACRSTDGSISDDEGLIEIAIPTGNYVGSKGGGEEQELCCQQVLPEISPESVYRWSEMNEEDNLIEIDISAGSIKCSRFEIKA